MPPRPTNSIPLRDGEAPCPEGVNHRASSPSPTPSDGPATALGARLISSRQSSVIAGPRTNDPEPSADLMPSPNCSSCNRNTPLGTKPCPKPSPALPPPRRSRPSSNSISKDSQTSSRRVATGATDAIPVGRCVSSASSCTSPRTTPYVKPVTQRSDGFYPATYVGNSTAIDSTGYGGGAATAPISVMGEEPALPLVPFVEPDWPPDRELVPLLAVSDIA
jgi:hypothetical protein